MDFNGFGFGGYRSFGNQLARIGPLAKINFLIGQNNSGKSNVINYLKGHFLPTKDRVKGKTNSVKNYESLDHHNSNYPSKYRISFLIDEVKFNRDIEALVKTIVGKEELVQQANLVVSHISHIENDHRWVDYVSDDPHGVFKLEYDQENLAKLMSAYDWEKLWKSITGESGGGLDQHWIPETVNLLSWSPEKNLNVEVIPAIREIGLAGSESENFGGKGIIDKLARLQNPSLDNQNDKKKFSQINKFLSDVLEKEATLDIPYERDCILVNMDGRILPLNSLGTGVHEIIILAVAATILSETLICIEEPELHLHPLLQRKLVKYLDENTNNKYLISTHSAHLLDSVALASIFHIRMNAGVSTVEVVENTSHRSQVCKDLGFKASDILQANCVIWVEGPSDRIYLKHWLISKDSSLVEGVHYSIIFYGGRLASHLSGLDLEDIKTCVDDLISLRKLNRNSVIVIDSDMAAPNSKINSTKQRLVSEFNSNSGFAWMTKGREIENYLDNDILEQAIKAVHPSAAEFARRNMFSNLLCYVDNKGEGKTANKVKVARKVVELGSADFNKLDLGERLDQLLKFISKNNL